MNDNNAPIDEASFAEGAQACGSSCSAVGVGDAKSGGNQ